MNRKYGFTLVELLAVVVILGILTAVAVPQYTKAIQRTEAANALVSLKTVYDAAKRYYASYETWPTSFNGLDTKLLLNTDADGTETNSSGAYQYTFDSTHKSVSACRTAENSDSSLYCLIAAYAPSFNATTNVKPDSYTCQYVAGKYKDLCSSLCKEGSTFTNQTCALN